MNKITLSTIALSFKERFIQNKIGIISLFLVTILMVILSETHIIDGIAKFALIPIIAAYQLGHYISERKQKQS